MSAVGDGQVWVAAVVCIQYELASVLAGAQCIVEGVEGGAILRGHCAVSGQARVRCGQGKWEQARVVAQCTSTVQSTSRCDGWCEPLSDECDCIWVADVVRGSQ